MAKNLRIRIRNTAGSGLWGQRSTESLTPENPVRNTTWQALSLFIATDQARDMRMKTGATGSFMLSTTRHFLDQPQLKSSW